MDINIFGNFYINFSQTSAASKTFKKCVEKVFFLYFSHCMFTPSQSHISGSSCSWFSADDQVFRLPRNSTCSNVNIWSFCDQLLIWQQLTKLLSTFGFEEIHHQQIAQVLKTNIISQLQLQEKNSRLQWNDNFAKKFACEVKCSNDRRPLPRH